MLPSAPYIGFVERYGVLLFRPTLQLTHSGQHKTETVSITYEGGHAGTAQYIRLWAYNFFGFPARSCQVFVNRISLNDKPLETERSPLRWKDVDTFELPMLRWKYPNGHYIDVCGMDTVDPRFQVFSQKGTKGYHRFRGEGLYTIDVSVEAAKPCSFGHAKISVLYDGTDMRLKGVQEGRKWSRLF